MSVLIVVRLWQQVDSASIGTYVIVRSCTLFCSWNRCVFLVTDGCSSKQSNYLCETSRNEQQHTDSTNALSFCNCCRCATALSILFCFSFRSPRSGEEQASAAGAATGWMQQLLTKVLANMSVSVSLAFAQHGGEDSPQDVRKMYHGTRVPRSPSHGSPQDFQH